MVFQCGCNSHKEYIRVPVYPHPCQHFLFYGFFTIAILVGVGWYYIAFLVHIFLMQCWSYSYWLFICLLWWNVYRNHLSIVLIELFAFTLLRSLCVRGGGGVGVGVPGCNLETCVLSDMCFANIFSCSGLASSFFSWCHSKHKSFEFWGAILTAYKNSWARDRIHATAITRATAVTTPDP